MAQAPLHLNWNDLLPPRDDAPTPELVVIPGRGGGSGAVEGDAGLLTELSDHQIQEKIQRNLAHISSGFARKLPDKGEKLRQSLHQLQAELDRRKLSRFSKEDEGLQVPGQSKSSESSVSHDVHSTNCTESEPRPQSSFATLFLQKLRGKADATLKEELRSTNAHKYRGSRENGERKHEGRHLANALLKPTRTPSRQSPFRCASSIANRDTQRSSNGDRKVAEPSNISSNVGRNFSSHSLKKRRASECGDLLHPRSKKVQHVVLLDEDEGQPKQMIHNDIPDEWKDAKIYYPSRDEPDSVELSYSDIRCLDPGSYIKSPIMNFYIRYLQKPVSLSGKIIGRYYFFNTYFCKKLQEAMSCEGDRSARFLKLRRWWKGVNLFQKAYIFLPIHDEMHWSLVIICIPPKEDESGPFVFHLDSLKLHASNSILCVVDSFLQDEWNYINQKDSLPDVSISAKIWKNLPCSIEKKQITVPQQKNDSDCGLFVLYYMERFMQEAPERLRKKDISSMFGREWFRPEDASGLRKWIRDLLVEEFENGRLENGRTESLKSSDGSPEGRTKSLKSSDGSPENDTDRSDEP